MANQIIGNVYVIDSQGLYLTGSTAVLTAGDRVGPYPDMAISNVGLYGSGTTGEIELTYLSNTTRTIFHLKTQAQQGGYDDIHFAIPFKISERVYVKTLTAGTGYLYFS